MYYKKLPTFSVRFFCIATFIAVPITIALIVFLVYSASIEKDKVGIAMEREARIMAIQEEEVFQGIRSVLVGVSQFSEVKNSNRRDCNKTLSVLLAHINVPAERFLNIGVAGPNGDTICSALPFSENINISDRDYFQRAIAARDFTFGNFQIGRVTRKPAINFAYPMMNDVGSIDFVVFAAINLDTLNKIVDDPKSLNYITATITDENSRIIFRYPTDGALIGQVFGDSFLKTSSKSDEGSYWATDIDGVPRIFGFSRIQLSTSPAHLHVIIGTSFSELIMRPPYDLLMWLIILFLLVIIASVLGWRFGGELINRLSLKRI